MMSAKPASRPSRLKRLGWTEFAVLAAILSVIAALSVMVLWPAVYANYIERFGIRRFESACGFRTGRVAVPELGDHAWGVTWVAPDGECAALGLRAGDVPVEYHGGMFALYEALRAAEEGRAASIDVINVTDWPTRREIRFSAMAIRGRVRQPLSQ
jgi:hypothetical protein